MVKLAKMSTGTKIVIAVCVIAVLAGARLAWSNYRLNKAIEATDKVVSEFRRSLQEAEERLTNIDQRVRREVSIIREATKQEVAVLDPSGVADGLNAELAEFRRMEGGSGGIHNE